MRKQFVIFAMAMLVATPALADDTSLGFGVFGGPTVGIGVWDFSGINNYLDPASVSNYDNAIPVYGLEANGVMFDRLALGFSGALGQESANGPDLQSDLWILNAAVDVGVLVFNAGGFRGYPVIGLGYGGVLMDISGDYTPLPLAAQAGVRYDSASDGGRASTAGDTRARPTQNDIRLRYDAVIARAAFHLDYVHPVFTSEHGFAFVFTGARVGMTADLLHRGWTLDGETLRGTEPDFRFDSGYVRLAFGFGAGAPSAMVMKMHEDMHNGLHDMLMPGDKNSRHDHAPEDPAGDGDSTEKSDEDGTGQPSEPAPE